MIGGQEKPISVATYYRGVAAGRYPPTVKVAPNIARVDLSELAAALRATAPSWESKRG